MVLYYTKKGILNINNRSKNLSLTFDLHCHCKNYNFDYVDYSSQLLTYQLQNEHIISVTNSLFCYNLTLEIILIKLLRIK